MNVFIFYRYFIYFFFLCFYFTFSVFFSCKHLLSTVKKDCPLSSAPHIKVYFYNMELRTQTVSSFYIFSLYSFELCVCCQKRFLACRQEVNFKLYVITDRHGGKNRTFAELLMPHTVALGKIAFYR